MIQLTALLAFAATSMCSIAEGQSTVDRPELFPGDSWTYQVTDGLTKQLIGKKSVQITAKNAKDYSVRTESEGNAGFVPTALSFNLGWVESIDGKETEHFAMNFPLVIGKTWETHELWKNSRGNNGWDDVTYKVVGGETITVPIGSFEAIKVTVEGRWKNVNGFSDKVEIVYWYVPVVKAITRTEYKAWYRGSLDTHRLFELTAFTVRKEGAAVAR